MEGDDQRNVTDFDRNGAVAEIEVERLKLTAERAVFDRLGHRVGGLAIQAREGGVEQGIGQMGVAVSHHGLNRPSPRIGTWGHAPHFDFELGERAVVVSVGRDEVREPVGWRDLQSAAKEVVDQPRAVADGAWSEQAERGIEGEAIQR
jgi:hypothetical protein